MPKPSNENSRADEWFRLIFEAVDDAILIHRADNAAIIDANSKACEMWGYSLKELRALDPGRLGSGTIPYTSQDIMNFFKGCSENPCGTFEWQASRKDGVLFWIEGRIRIAEIGGKDMLVLTCRNTTERKRIESELDLHQHHLMSLVEERSSELNRTNETLRNQMLERVKAEETLRENEKKYRTIIEELTEGFILIDGQGYICEWNAAIEHLSGRPKETVIGTYFWDTMAILTTEEAEQAAALRESYAESLRHATRETLLSGRTAPLNASLPDCIRKPSGSPVLCRMTAFPVGMDSGWHAGLVITRR